MAKNAGNHVELTGIVGNKIKAVSPRTIQENQDRSIQIDTEPPVGVFSISFPQEQAEEGTAKIVARGEQLVTIVIKLLPGERVLVEGRLVCVNDSLSVEALTIVPVTDAKAGA